MSPGLTGLCHSLFAPIGSRATMLGTTYSLPPTPFRRACLARPRGNPFGYSGSLAPKGGPG